MRTNKSHLSALALQNVFPEFQGVYPTTVQKHVPALETEGRQSELHIKAILCPEASEDNRDSCTCNTDQRVNHSISSV